MPRHPSRTTMAIPPQAQRRAVPCVHQGTAPVVAPADTLHARLPETLPRAITLQAVAEGRTLVERLRALRERAYEGTRPSA